MDVLSFILGQGKNSLLYRKVVEESELASSASVNYLTPRQRGLMIVTVVGDPDSVSDLRAAVVEQVNAVKEGQFTDQDMERAKAHLLQSYLQNNETNSGKADTIGFYSALGVPDFWKTYPDRVRAVTREEVLAAANKYLTDGYWGYVLKPRGR